jgi:hypothetical protein
MSLWASDSTCLSSLQNYSLLGTSVCLSFPAEVVGKDEEIGQVYTAIAVQIEQRLSASEIVRKEEEVLEIDLASPVEIS